MIMKIKTVKSTLIEWANENKWAINRSVTNKIMDFLKNKFNSIQNSIQIVYK